MNSVNHSRPLLEQCQFSTTLLMAHERQRCAVNIIETKCTYTIKSCNVVYTVTLDLTDVSQWLSKLEFTSTLF